MPADYINNMLRMFQDIKLSQDLNQEFKEFKEGPAVGAVASGRGITDVVNIKILNVGSWVRSTDIVPVSLPIELEDLIPEVILSVCLIAKLNCTAFGCFSNITIIPIYLLCKTLFFECLCCKYY